MKIQNWVKMNLNTLLAYDMIKCKDTSFGKTLDKNVYRKVKNVLSE